MKQSIYLILFLSISFGAFSQQAWTWTPLSDMPAKISNNAVTQGTMGGNMYVYSFGGIDTTKVWTGQSKRAFRYDVTNDVWDEIDTLPVVLPLIASSANTVKNKIYIIGGYNVQSGGGETSSDEVIIYDPETNTYLPNGAAVPVPIDDQSQMVWRDSLIFVVTGWSNTTNVTAVQIYDPALDQWQAGTDVPNSSVYRVFGSSGQIIGDTIYYYGGASTGINFPAQWKLRKGVINPADPTQITWSELEDAPNRNYRSACLTHANDLFWVGGSATSYNYNGIAYNGSGGVEPSMNIDRYEAYYTDWFEGSGTPYGKMDMRGSGQVSATEWIICGGMEAGQAVTNTTFLLTYDPVTGGIEKDEKNLFKIVNRVIDFSVPADQVKLYSLEGKLASTLIGNKIPAQFTGTYILEFNSEGKVYRKKIHLN